MNEQLKGTVKWWNPNKGFGFIVPDISGRDVFVHVTAVEASGLKALTDGQKVTYDIQQARGKEAACNIKIVT